jgi:hypothetical protein
VRGAYFLFHVSDLSVVGLGLFTESCLHLGNNNIVASLEAFVENVCVVFLSIAGP